MDSQAVKEQIKDLIQDFLKTHNIDLVDIIYRHEGRDLFLRILVDKPEGGISLEECAFVNESVGRILDETELVHDKYILEVSSPGLDRPLRTKQDFSRCLNRKARFFLTENINGKIELDGTIEKVEEESVFIRMREGFLKIPFRAIRKAKQIIT